MKLSYFTLEYLLLLILSLVQMKSVSDVTLRLWIIPSTAEGGAENLSPLLPACGFVNIELVPGSKLCGEGGEGVRATLLLENPVGQNLLTFDQLQLEVGSLRASHDSCDCHVIPWLQCATLLKMYVRHTLVVYEATPTGLKRVELQANLLQFAGHTLYISAEVHTHTHTRTLPHMHTPTHTHIHVHTHTHTHTKRPTGPAAWFRRNGMKTFHIQVYGRWPSKCPIFMTARQKRLNKVCHFKVNEKRN